MKQLKPYYTYDQISVMMRQQRRRIYRNDQRIIRVFTTIPAIIFIIAAFIYGFVGWATAFDAVYSHEYHDYGILGIFDFLVFAVCCAVIAIQGEKWLFAPIAFFAYITLDMLIHMKISVVLAAMLIYIVTASYFVGRHDANIRLLKMFDDFPFICTSDDVGLRTFRNEDVIRDLEKTADKTIREIQDMPPQPKKEREEYTTRRW